MEQGYSKEEINRNLAVILNNQRVLRNVSMKDLHGRTGIPISTLYRLLRDKDGEITFGNAFLIANALGLKISVLRPDEKLIIDIHDKEFVLI